MNINRGCIGALLILTIMTSTPYLFALNIQSGEYDSRISTINEPSVDDINPISMVNINGEDEDKIDVQKRISTVPAYLWADGCGCAPTAFGMILGYYDIHGFPSLFEGEADINLASVHERMASQEHRIDYAIPNDYKKDVPDIDKSGDFYGWPAPKETHEDNCIADFLKTSRSVNWNTYGATQIKDISSGIVAYIQSRNRNYITEIDEYYWNINLNWINFCNEIDNDRPVHLFVDTDGGGVGGKEPDGKGDHSIVALGYGYHKENGKRYYCCYHCGDTSFHWFEFTGMGIGQDFGIDMAHFIELEYPSKNYYVDDVPGSGINNPHEDFISIQNAINHAHPGDTIFVYSGFYHENIYINKDNICLVGESAISTIIYGISGDVIYIDADEITINSFSIRNGMNGIYIHGKDHNIIENNIIFDNENNGLFLDRIGPIRSQNNKILKNSVYDNGGLGVYFQMVEQSLVQDNDIYYNGLGGIRCLGFRYNEIMYNKIHENFGFHSYEGYGIEVGGYHQKILYNDIFENWNSGVNIVQWTSNIIIKNNKIHHNSWEGIESKYIEGGYNIISQNEIYYNSRTGVFLFYSNNYCIIENIIHHNNEGISLLFANNNMIEGNHIYDTKSGIHCQGSSNNLFLNNHIYNTDTTGNDQWSINLGIDLMWGCDNNRIVKNTISYIGRYLYPPEPDGKALNIGDSMCNIIHNNLIIYSLDVGIYLSISENNMIYQNSIIQNRYPISIIGDTGVNNIIHHNYWSDYSGLDDGSNGRIAGDNIGDTNLPHYEVDDYPLMTPYNIEGTTIEGSDIEVHYPQLFILYDHVTSTGITSLNSFNHIIPENDQFQLLQPLYDIETTASFEEEITVGIQYPAELSLEDEERLAILHFNEATGILTDITKIIDITNNIIFGNTNTLSTFTVILRYNQKPVANAGLDQELLLGESVILDGTGSSDVDGTIVSYDWDFGDGTPHGTGATVSHTYADHGTYTVTLTVTDDDGDTDTDTCTITVLNNPPTADAGSDQTVFLGTTITFSGSGSSDVDGTIVSYDWDFDDGTTHGTGVSTTHTYTDHGTYTVTLTVTDDDGDTGTDTCTVTVLNNPPVAVAGVDMTLIVGETGSFDGSSSSDVDGTVISYDWDFGDGSSHGSGETTTHSYSTAGTYTVTLTVTDDDGATDTDTLTVTVLTPIEAIDLLASIKEAMDLHHGIENSLDKKLENAQKSLEKGNDDAAVNQLEAFINEVEAQRGKKITEEQADTLVEYAQWIIDNI